MAASRESITELLKLLGAPVWASRKIH